jgi:metal-responsive CopG/Arc/MetJ family transcriptional regulator
MMKPIQITIDEKLLAELDACPEARVKGRSAVVRHALQEYLRQRRLESIARQYEQAYSREPGLGEEFAGWEEQGRWPER